MLTMVPPATGPWLGSIASSDTTRWWWNSTPSELKHPPSFDSSTVIFLLPLVGGIVHATAVLEIHLNSDTFRPTRHIPAPVLRKFVPPTVTTMPPASRTCPWLGLTVYTIGSSSKTKPSVPKWASPLGSPTRSLTEPIVCAGVAHVMTESDTTSTGLECSEAPKMHALCVARKKPLPLTVTRVPPTPLAIDGHTACTCPRLTYSKSAWFDTRLRR